MKFYSLLLLLCISLLACQQKKTPVIRNTNTELKSEWVFAEEGKKNWLPAKVPGVIHLDLLNNQVIEDPYFEQNELKQRWIEEKNWVYKTEFNLSQEFRVNDNIELDFKGLDTYAKVYLNDSLVLETNNMFRSWQVDLRYFAKTGKNKLEVHFKSPINYNRDKVNKYPHTLPSGNETADIETKVSNFSRKAAYQFGWDWGPRFVSSGIWRPIRISSWNGARIKDVFTSTQKIENDTAYMLTQVEIEVGPDGSGIYTIMVDGKPYETTLLWGTNTLNHKFKVAKPKLWWCNGLGKPNLHAQKVQLFNDEYELESRENRYGIRTIELINEPDSIGTSFYFKLNGKPVFMKGANYIPQDLFLPRVSTSQYERLINKVKDANMNMLRVWGGGIYEEDIFYDLCDENGILIWQDFMFAGSLYPNIEGFKENVKQEVRENIKRLRPHPSLALWCGNNEINVAWNNWGWQKQYGYNTQDSTEIWDFQRSIFEELIPNQIDELDSLKPYTPTSPLSNWGTAENFNHNSMHYWGVWHGKEPFENFEKNVGRFMVEYGFQSFPNIETLSKTMEDSSLYLQSAAMQSRQKSYIGNGLIENHILQYYNEPKSFEEFVALSQKTQAKGLKMAIEAHLNAQPHCMGSLFWQLNDCWPGPSWSVIDYYGEEKEAYQSVKSSFSK